MMWIQVFLSINNRRLQWNKSWREVQVITTYFSTLKLRTCERKLMYHFAKLMQLVAPFFNFIFKPKTVFVQ